MDIKDNILSKIEEKVLDEFQSNFDRKAFFANPWPETKKPSKQGGTLMNRTGRLRNSIQSMRDSDKIDFVSNVPYAEVVSEGGLISRTAKTGKTYTIEIPQRKFMGEAENMGMLMSEAISETMGEDVEQFMNQIFNK